MKLGDVSVAFVELMRLAMSRLGHDATPMLQQFQLDDLKLASPDARISIPRFMRLGHACIEVSDKPSLGLEMGRQTKAPHLGLAGLLAMSAPNVRISCQALATYELLSSFNARGRSQFKLEQGCGVASFYSVSPYNAYNLFVVDSVLCGWYHFLQWVTGRTDLVKRIEFEFSAPSYVDEYQGYFQCPVHFEATRNAVVLHEWALEIPSLHACASTYEALRRSAERELEHVRLGLSYRETVARAIGPLLDGNTPTLEQVAHRLNTAPWTLRRRLSAEGHSFQEVLNTTRRDLAVSYVRDTTLTLGEIAFLLGFGSATAFQRAFKRWTGEAPGRFREEKRRSYISTASSTSSS